jgi:hypothetical protein
MKTFIEFLDEALKGRKDGVASSKKDAIEKGLRFFTGSDGEEREIRNYGSKVKPGGNVRRVSTMDIQRARYTSRGKDVTSSDADLPKFAKKKRKINNRGKEAHHNMPLERTSHVSSMSPEERSKFHRTMNSVGSFVGNDRRNLISVTPDEHKEIHKTYKAMDRSIKNAGKKSDSVFGRLKKLREMKIL